MCFKRRLLLRYVSVGVLFVVMPKSMNAALLGALSENADLTQWQQTWQLQADWHSHWKNPAADNYWINDNHDMDLSWQQQWQSPSLTLQYRLQENTIHLDQAYATANFNQIDWLIGRKTGN